MKKSILALGLAFAALTLPSCSQNEELDVTPVVTPSFELYANIDTRTVNDGVKTNWVAGDQINVFHAEAGATEVEYVNDNAFETKEADGLFKGSLAGELTAEAYDWFALYPYNSNIKTPANTDYGYITVGAKVQTQNGNNSMAHLAGSNCPLVGVAKGVAAGVKPEFTMNHISAVAKFVVKNTLSEAITVDHIYFTAPDGKLITGTYFVNFVEYPSVVYTGSGSNYTSNVATLNVTDGTAIAAGESAEFYLAMVPFTLEVGDALNIKVSAKVGEETIVDEADVELDNDLTLAAGHIKVFNVNFDTQAVAVIEKPTIAEFLEKKVDSTVWYELTGTIKNLVNDTYGNFDLVDETGSVYVYGLTATQVAKNDKSFASLGLKEGDVVTMMGTRAEYKSQDQVGGPAYYVSHVASAAAPEIACADNTVTITAETGATIHYTTNGDEPTATSAVYSEPFAITESCTVKAIAVVEGKPQSAVASKACAFVNPDEPVVETATATLSFADAANRTSYSTTQQVWQQNGIKVVNNQAKSTTAVADYKNPARFYQGSELIISTTLGNIVSMEFTCSGGKNLSGTYEGATLTANNNIITVNVTNPASSFTFASLAEQARVSQIVITYIPGEGGEDVVTKENQSISFEKESYTAEVGDEFTATLNGAQTTVTYTSSNTDVATVDENTGAVTAVAAGTTTITATAAENDEYYGATAKYTLTVTAPATGDDGTINVGAVLWSETFSNYGGNSTTFASNKTIDDYDYSGRSGFGDNATSVTLTADASNNVRCTTGTGTNCSGGHLWFNKNASGTLTSSAIKLYGVTSLSFSHAQGTSKSMCTSEYSTDGGSTWTKLGDCSGNVAKQTYSFTVPEGTESIQIKLSHPATNDKNTRVDNLELVVAE